MSSVIKFAKTIRNNWKKSVFAALAVSYGISYGNEKYKYVKKKTKINLKLLQPSKYYVSKN